MNEKYVVPKRYDITGQVFSRLTVVRYYGKNKYNNNLWKCKCECGNETIVPATLLRQGNTRSCGCLQKEKATKHLMDITITHGLSRDSQGKKTRLYQIWSGMKTRCFNANVQEYPRYGGRGISMCSEWIDNFKAFHGWAMANGYKDNLEIDRIDVDGDYEPSNCRWVTTLKQSNNRRTNKLVTYNGETKTLSEWARWAELEYVTFWNRLKNGWEFDRAIAIPTLTYGRKIKPNGRSKESEIRVRSLVTDERYSKLVMEVEKQ